MAASLDIARRCSSSDSTSRDDDEPMTEARRCSAKRSIWTSACSARLRRACRSRIGEILEGLRRAAPRRDSGRPSLATGRPRRRVPAVEALRHDRLPAGRRRRSPAAAPAASRSRVRDTETKTSDIQAEAPDHAVDQRIGDDAEQGLRPQPVEAEQSLRHDVTDRQPLAVEAGQEQRVGPDRQADDDAADGTAAVAARQNRPPKKAGRELRDRADSDRRPMLRKARHRVAQPIIGVGEDQDREDRDAPTISSSDAYRRVRAPGGRAEPASRDCSRS